MASSRQAFPGSAAYWERRYKARGNSGIGSYGKFAQFKAEVVNAFVADRGIRSVIEFGCGDGNQLRLAGYPQYLGFDVSQTAMGLCKATFQSDPTKSFKLMREYANEKADLTVSLDVIYHFIDLPPHRG
jgi:hypothetical protein